MSIFKKREYNESVHEALITRLKEIDDKTLNTHISVSFSVFLIVLIASPFLLPISFSHPLTKDEIMLMTMIFLVEIILMPLLLTVVNIGGLLKKMSLLKSYKEINMKEKELSYFLEHPQLQLAIINELGQMNIEENQKIQLTQDIKEALIYLNKGMVFKGVFTIGAGRRLISLLKKAKSIEKRNSLIENEFKCLEENNKELLEKIKEAVY